VDAAGEVSCLSYINNLHPVRQAMLYDTICSVLSAFIPLFERVLTELRLPRPARVPVGSWYDDDDAASCNRRQREMQADGEADEQQAEEEDDDDDEDMDDPRAVLQPEALLPFKPSPPAPSPCAAARCRSS
jgi:hypothetical protein